jgi:hypothetical protein
MGVLHIEGAIMNTKKLLVLLILVGILTACAQPTGAYPPAGSTTAVPTATVETPAATEQPSEVPPTSTPAQPAVELSAAQQAAIQEISTKYNITPDQIKISSTEPMTWSNGCMGVVIPGVMCADVIVDGFVIKLEANGQQFEIHTNHDGTSVIDAAEQLATLGFVVRNADSTLQVVNPHIPLGPTYNPAFNGFLPSGGSILGTAYVLDTSLAKAVAVDANGQHDLNFIQKPTYGLAIWRGGEGSQPMLAWGTQLNPDSGSSLMIASPDGSNLETLLTINMDTTFPVQLVAELWSADGKYVYFSKEPVGLGGYILFSGASNLYKIDIETKEVSEIIPQATSGPQICLDAISGDYRFVADNCTENAITIRDLQNGSSATIQAPSDVTGYRLMGSARFNPAGDQVAFAIAQGNPDDEHGWVAVGDSTGGTSRLVLTGNAGNFYMVLGWLDDQTLLVQSISINNPNVGNQLFTVGPDGSNLTEVAHGMLLAIIDNR